MRAPELIVTNKIVRDSRACAYVSTPEGQVCVCWPDGSVSRSTERPGQKDYVPEFARWELAGLGLSPADCSAIARLWRSGGETLQNRAQRLRAVQSIAGDRARGRAELLRALRRGEQPRGSITAAKPIGEGLCALIRFPCGGGWWASDAAPGEGSEVMDRPWPWYRRPACRLLAVDLTEEQCRAVARCTTAGFGEGERNLREVCAHLQERGLLL